MPNETVAEFEAELQHLATHCAFGDYLSEAIRDHTVCGLRNEGTQKRLLAENDLTVAKIMEITQNMEAADRNAQKLKGSEPNLQVSKISLGPTSKFCYRCGSDQHRPKDYRFREAECRNCKKKGHVARMCQSKARISQKSSWKNPEQTRASLAKV